MGETPWEFVGLCLWEEQRAPLSDPAVCGLELWVGMCPKRIKCAVSQCLPCRCDRCGDNPHLTGGDTEAQDKSLSAKGLTLCSVAKGSNELRSVASEPLNYCARTVSAGWTPGLAADVGVRAGCTCDLAMGGGLCWERGSSVP